MTQDTTPSTRKEPQVFSFDLDMISIGCVASPMSPVAKFSSRVSAEHPQHSKAASHLLQKRQMEEWFKKKLEIGTKTQSIQKYSECPFRSHMDSWPRNSGSAGAPGHGRWSSLAISGGDQIQDPADQPVAEDGSRSWDILRSSSGQLLGFTRTWCKRLEPKQYRNIQKASKSHIINDSNKPSRSSTPCLFQLQYDFYIFLYIFTTGQVLQEFSRLLIRVELIFVLKESGCPKMNSLTAAPHTSKQAFSYSIISLHFLVGSQIYFPILRMVTRTCGTLFVVFFISLCSSLLAPFRCTKHPNGRWTVQAYHGVTLGDGWRLNYGMQQWHESYLEYHWISWLLKYVLIWMRLYIYMSDIY